MAVLFHWIFDHFHLPLQLVASFRGVLGAEWSKQWCMDSLPPSLRADDN